MILQSSDFLGLKLDSSSWSMVRGRDYVGNLNEIQQRFIKGNYKGGHGKIEGKVFG